MPPFGEAILILVQLPFLLGCLIVVPYAIYRLIRFKKIGLILGIAALLTLPIYWNLLMMIFLGGEDINPPIDSREQLIGLYSN